MTPVRSVPPAGRFVLIVVTLVVALASLALGIWQLRRLGTRRAANREAAAMRAMPPLRLGAVPAILAPNRRAQARGSYDEEREFLLRDRVVQGVPAVLVITPLRIAGQDTAILVNRGFVPAPDATDPGNATWAEPGQVQVRGVLLPIPDRNDGDPIRHAGRETWQSFDLKGMRERLPYPIAPVFLVAVPDSGSLVHTIRGRAYPFRAEPPELGEGPHLAYAVQWFMIAAAAIVYGVLFALRPPTSRLVE